MCFVKSKGCTPLRNPICGRSKDASKGWLVRRVFSKFFKKILYEKQESKNNWNGLPFGLIDNLKCDYSGKVGENYIYSLCNFLNIENIYCNDDTNTTDGVYDIIINNKKVEIKTARFGLSSSFQHESLRNGGCDYYLFVLLMTMSWKNIEQ